MKKSISLGASLAVFGLLGALVAPACGGTSTDSGFGPQQDAAADARGDDASGSSDGTLISDGPTLGDSSSGCPSTCQELGANCGAVTDTEVRRRRPVRDVPGGQTCGGGGVPNQCGAGSAPTRCCADDLRQRRTSNCGQAGDGCGNTLACGTCTAPQTCGGDPTKPGQCGCTGTCAPGPDVRRRARRPRSRGTVLDPAGIHPLYNALVYIPNNPTDPGLQPFPAGITCDRAAPPPRATRW